MQELAVSPAAVAGDSFRIYTSDWEVARRGELARGVLLGGCVMVWSLLSLLVLLPDNAFLPPPADPSACASEPLQLTLGDMLRMGELGQRIVTSRCGGVMPHYMVAAPTPYGVTLGKMTLGTFVLADHIIEVGFDLRMVPGLWFGGYPRGLLRGNSDELRFAPVLRLPPDWQAKVDMIREPLLAVTGVAILGGVIAGIFAPRKAHP